jgi:hypothetical protein
MGEMVLCHFDESPKRKLWCVEEKFLLSFHLGTRVQYDRFVFTNSSNLRPSLGREEVRIFVNPSEVLKLLSFQKRDLG